MKESKAEFIPSLFLHELELCQHYKYSLEGQSKKEYHCFQKQIGPFQNKCIPSHHIQLEDWKAWQFFGKAPALKQKKLHYKLSSVCNDDFMQRHSLIKTRNHVNNLRLKQFVLSSYRENFPRNSSPCHPYE